MRKQLFKQLSIIKFLQKYNLRINKFDEPKMLWLSSLKEHQTNKWVNVSYNNASVTEIIKDTAKDHDLFIPRDS